LQRREGSCRQGRGERQIALHLSVFTSRKPHGNGLNQENCGMR
jgi:hypothetical protein